jgi:hypothetical protein
VTNEHLDARYTRSHLGYWSGAEDYTAHTVNAKNPAGDRNVFDFQEGLAPRTDLNGSWSTGVFAARAVSLIAA